MIEVDWVKMHAAKKAYKHEVLIKISQKARFEKNYIVWKVLVVEVILAFCVSLRRTI